MARDDVDMPDGEIDPDVAAFIEQTKGDEDLAIPMVSAVLEDGSPPEDIVEKAPIWLITFGDVTALMLAFFVMLYSMSHMQSEKWDAVISILATRSDLTQEGRPLPTAERSITRVDFVPAFSTGYLEQILTQSFEADPLMRRIRLTGLDEQLVISLPGDLLFEGLGSHALTAEAEEILGRLNALFNTFGNQIDIHSHTAPSAPPAGSVFRDNWTLSLGRGLVVAQHLNELGYPGDFTVMGLGSSRFLSIDADIPEARRFALARRIDLVISPEARGQ